MTTLNQNSPSVKTLVPDVESLIESGPVTRAQKFAIYGPIGIGKTWLARLFPGEVIILDTEDGSLNYDVKRIRALDSDSFHAALRALTKTQEPTFKTLVIDTVDMAEKYLRDRVLRIHRMNAIEDFGYGKGWIFLREEFERFLADLDRLIARGVHIVIVGHSIVKRHQPPLAETGYDRYQLKLYEANSNRLIEWADHVLFLNWETRVVEGRTGKPHGAGGRTRVIHTTHSAGWDAKTRGDLPEKISCEFGALLPLFGPLRKEVSEQDLAADASSSSQDTTAPLPTRNPELYDQLLGSIGTLDKEDVRAYLVGRKLVSEGGWLDDLSDDKATWIVTHVEKFQALVAKFANEPF